MARAGSGHQNIRRVEDQAIAKADRHSKRTHSNRTQSHQTNKKHVVTTEVWRYKQVNGKWQLIAEIGEAE